MPKYVSMQLNILAKDIQIKCSMQIKYHSKALCNLLLSFNIIVTIELKNDDYFSNNVKQCFI